MLTRERNDAIFGPSIRVFRVRVLPENFRNALEQVSMRQVDSVAAQIFTWLDRSELIHLIPDRPQRRWLRHGMNRHREQKQQGRAKLELKLRRQAGEKLTNPKSKRRHPWRFLRSTMRSPGQSIGTTRCERCIKIDHPRRAVYLDDSSASSGYSSR
jgi:hypothetical protein